MGVAAGRCTIGIRLLTRFPNLDIDFATDDYLDVKGAYTNRGRPLVYFDCNGCRLRTPSHLLWSVDQDASAASMCLWLQLDVDTGEVRLRVNEDDYGILHTLTPGFARPVHPFFRYLGPGEAFELLPM
jgi:hypothetical protein